MFRVILLLMHANCMLASSTYDRFVALSRAHKDVCLTSDSNCKTGIGFPRFPRQAVTPSAQRCCGYCTCDEKCFDHGSCCLGQYQHFEDARYRIVNTRYECVKPQYLTSTKALYRSEDADKAVWMVTKCQQDVPNRLKERCEKPEKDGTFDSLVPVMKDTITYRNKFCALCNAVDFVSDLIKWRLEILCGTVLELPDKNLLITIKEKQCEIVFKPPNVQTVQRCEITPYNISTCNVTGKWTRYDADIELACQSFIDPFNLTYRNYFCYMCNIAELSPPESWWCQDGRDFTLDTNPPFSALLDLNVINDMKKDEELHCDENTQFEDNKLMTCRDVICHPDRHLHDRRCLYTPTNADVSPCYSVFIRLSPLGTTTLLEDTFADEIFLSSLERDLASEIPGFYRHVEKLILYYKLKHQDDFVDFFIIQLIIHFDNSDGNDIFHHIVSKIHNHVFYVFLREPPIKFFANCVSYNSSGNETHLLISVPRQNSASFDQLSSVYTKQTRPNDTCQSKKLLTFKRLHICPYVTLSFTEFAMKIENALLVITDSFAENITVSNWEFEEQGHSVSICLRDYLYIYELMPENDWHSKHKGIVLVQAKQILSLICVCLSIACLFVTIVTYIVFEELQSQPGVNNIVLCIFLIMSQSLYQFGAGHRSLTTFVCTLIGALCHFLWLAVMFSMNICCIQMFMTFRSSIKLSARFDFKLTLKYLLYITGASLLLVVTNVAASLAYTNGKDTGYGGNICYVSSAIMLLITFIVPSAITIAVNITLFSYVVFSINKIRTSSATLNKEERNYFAVYGRLSSLTGLTWIFGYLFLLLKHEILEYLFIVLNASQGVFIMIAFVLNKRIYLLICSRTGLRRRKPVNPSLQKTETTEHRTLGVSVLSIEEHADNHSIRNTGLPLGESSQILGCDPLTDKVQ